MKSFNYRQGTVEQLLKDRISFEKLIASLDRDVVSSQRWYRRKNLAISKVKLAEFFYIKPADRNKIPFCITIIEVVCKDKTKEIYFFPIAFSKNPFDEHSQYLKLIAKDGIYYGGDALAYEPFIKFINECMDNKTIIKGPSAGSIHFEGTAGTFKPFCEEIKTNSTNSLIRLSYKSILKIIRKVEEGINVEFEMGDFLTRHGFQYSAPLEGGITYVTIDGGTNTLGLKFKEIENHGDGWSFSAQEIPKYFDFVSAGHTDEKIKSNFLKPYLREVSILASVIAELHATLIKDKEHLRFKPEHFSEHDIDQWEESFLNLVKRALDDAQKYVLDHPDESDKLNRATIPIDTVKRAFERIKKSAAQAGNRTRIHCDLHLGQVLKIRDGFAVIDFEGEPLRTIDERASKYSPLRDVAGMLRSFHYAAFAAYFKFKGENNADELLNYASGWAEIVSKHFTREYIDACRRLRVSSVPYSNLPMVQRMLALYKLEKAIYELCYELNNRPDWVLIPVEGIKTCLAELESAQ
jgi:trehalose synthase-fused probable maltokinase